MTFRKHLLISFLVSVLIAILFVFITKDLKLFNFTEEFQLIPEGFSIPRGCDVRMDMQTGQIWAKLSARPKSNDSIISIFSSEESIETNQNINSKAKSIGTGAPEYQNLTKSRIQSRYSYGSAEKIELALQELEIDTEDSWKVLEEESPAMEVGLGILESNKFSNLREKIAIGNGRALNVLSMCLQNNPLAVEKAIEIGLLDNEILSLFTRIDLNLNIYQKLLKIYESFSKYNETEEGKKILLEIRVEITKQNLIHGTNLNERSLDIIREIQN